MTSLLPSPGRATGERPEPGPDTASRSPATSPRPLALVATLAGVAASAATLTVCLALGVAGWFLVDSGAHGSSEDGLRYGALAWLLGHGSGVSVGGTPVTMVPLGLTLLLAVVTWRVAVRAGEALAGHGPDADRLGDGERDWTVPVAAALFVAGYVAVTVVVVVLAASPATGPDTMPALVGATSLAAVVGAPGLATGSGRAALWASRLPAAVPATAAACARILLGTAVASLAVVVVALLAGADDVVNVFSRLHTGAGEATTMVVVSLALLPNAAAYASSWLLGPGFAFGTQTVVSPGLVVLGPVPMFPLLGALPAGGEPPAWTIGAFAVLPLVAAVAVARSQRRHPTRQWEQGALRGCAAGVLAGVVVAALAWLAGGALGPGRMTEIGPDALAVLVHAVPSLGLGGLLGGLGATWWQRRTAA